MHERSPHLIELARSGTWEETSMRAWRDLLHWGVKFNAQYYGIISDTYPQQDSGVARYRGISRRPENKEFYERSEKLAEDILISTEGGLQFVSFVRVSGVSGGMLINTSRSNRRSYVLVAPTNSHPVSTDEMISAYVEARKAGDTMFIDDPTTRSFFLVRGLFPVRSKGEFDDSTLALSIG